MLSVDAYIQVIILMLEDVNAAITIRLQFIG